MKTTGVTATANFATAPDGTMTASKVVYDGTGASDAVRCYAGSSGAVPPNQSRFVGVWLRAASGTVPVKLDANGYYGVPAVQAAATFTLTTQWQFLCVWKDGDGWAADWLNIGTAGNAAQTIYVWGARIWSANPFPRWSSVLPSRVTMPERGGGLLSVLGNSRVQRRAVARPSVTWKESYPPLKLSDISVTAFLGQLRRGYAQLQLWDVNHVQQLGLPANSGIKEPWVAYNGGTTQTGDALSVADYSGISTTPVLQGAAAVRLDGVPFVVTVLNSGEVAVNNPWAIDPPIPAQYAVPSRGMIVLPVPVLGGSNVAGRVLYSAVIESVAWPEFGEDGFARGLNVSFREAW